MAGFDLVALVFQAFANVWGSTVGILPNIVAAVLILIVGFIAGKVVGAALEEILARTKVDDYVKVKKAEFQISHVVTLIIKWVIYLVFIQQATAALGITVISAFVGEIVSFVPSALTAVIVVAAGYAVARYIEGLISDSDFQYAHLMSRVFFFMIIYIAIALALPKVGLDAGLVNSILLIIVASIGFGFAIALGLGLKDTISEVARDQSRRMKR
ncbi:MAG TPA: hypothetical protein VJB90_05925 [Candidatus Nanoarchaeia archaeon]|nr:hypothetical protein [Candidatus Nanoarchaeia archaeon]